MRYCRHCRKWNADWPIRCRYCRAGLEGRLCPAGHVNPPDASLAFCGECGKPLEEHWGAGFSFRPYLLGFGIAMITIFFSLGVAQVAQRDSPLVTDVVVLIILIVGFRLSFRILPHWMGKFTSDVITFFMRLILGTGIKGKK
jgi:hypothetical protein